MTDLPVNFEAEIQILGNILARNDTFDRVADFLTPEMFADDRHARIYATCVALIGDGQKATPVTLKSRLEADKALQEVGGIQYLWKLAKAAVSPIYAEQHGRLIQECWQRRQIIEAAQEAVERARDPDTAPGVLASEFGDRLDVLTIEGPAAQDLKTLGDAYDQALQQAERAWQSADHVSGLSTGLWALDKRTGGLHAGELVIAAGRPSMGKSALAYQIARHNAVHWSEKTGSDGQKLTTGAKVLLFTLEMSAGQIAMRDLASDTGVSTDRQRRGQFNDLDMLILNTAAQKNRHLPIYMVDLSNLSISQLRQRARRYHRKYGIGLIVVDYLQLLHGSQQKFREQEISEIAKGLKSLARALNVPVLALSQLSRKVEEREDKRPQLSDLRESGSLEQDADAVWLMYREEYYLEREEPKRRDDETDEKYTNRVTRWIRALEACKGKGEVMVAKQRMGPIGPALLGWNGERTRFENL